jgi:4-amino-4-deoxy-L-arabinose transferase-like glycosyltransferase
MGVALTGIWNRCEKVNTELLFKRLRPSGDFLKRNTGIAVLAGLSLPLLFAGLGKDYLWADEGDTAVLASNILKFGVPKAWDGVTFTDSDMGARLNDDLVMVCHPWVQYYVTAASFLLFGETALAARLPFALAAWLTLLLTYRLVLKLTQDRRAAFSAACLLLLSVQFLLYARQCRNYSLNMLLTLSLVLLFFEVGNRRGKVWFALAAVLLFHTHPIAIAPIGALGLLTLVYRPFFYYRRGFLISMVPVCLLTLPWILWADQGYRENVQMLRGMDLFGPRVTQFFIESASVAPLMDAILLLVFLWFRHRGKQAVHARSHGETAAPTTPVFTDGERSLVIVVAALFVAYALLMVVTQSRASMMQIGMRHASPLIPLMMAMTGVLIIKVSSHNAKVWLLLMLVLGFTHLGHIALWAADGARRLVFGPEQGVPSVHMPPRWVDRFFTTSQIGFLKELCHRNVGTVGEICEFLNRHAKPGDILITNYEWDPIYFHTRLRQGLKIFPEYPIYRRAREKGLPEYVFSVEGVRWIVWRSAWGNIRGYDIAELDEEALKRRGARTEIVATLHETMWENREDLHFHRFPHHDYKYGWFGTLPPTVVVRVTWPAGKRYDPNCAPRANQEDAMRSRARTAD